MITREDVLKRFEYRKDGHLYRRDNSGPARAGDQLGTIRKSNSNYYRKAVIDGVVMSVHRLIFFDAPQHGACIDRPHQRRFVGQPD